MFQRQFDKELRYTFAPGQVYEGVTPKAGRAVRWEIVEQADQAGSWWSVSRNGKTPERRYFGDLRDSMVRAKAKLVGGGA